MMTYNEMAQNALARIEEEKSAQKKRRKKLLAAAIPAFVLIVAAAVGFGFFRTPQVPAAEPVQESPVSAAASQHKIENENQPVSQAVSQPSEDKAVTYVSYFDCGVNQAEASYIVPDNGSFGYSVPLCQAIEYYGDTAQYHVLIHYFTERIYDYDPERLAAEAARLNSLGYDTAVFDQIVNGNGVVDYVLSMCAEKSQLENFPAESDHAYMFFLYGEFFEDDGMYGEVQSAAAIEAAGKELYNTEVFPFEEAEIQYEAPKNGSVNYSMPLRKGLERLGDNEIVTVVVDLFRDEEQIGDIGILEEEQKRLVALGYDAGVDFISYGVERVPMLTFKAVTPMIRDFKGLEEYGYMLYFYKEERFRSNDGVTMLVDTE